MSSAGGKTAWVADLVAAGCCTALIVCVLRATDTARHRCSTDGGSSIARSRVRSDTRSTRARRTARSADASRSVPSGSRA